MNMSMKAAPVVLFCACALGCAHAPATTTERSESLRSRFGHEGWCSERYSVDGGASYTRSARKQYDARGDVREELLDLDGDGVFEYQTRWERDERGDVITRRDAATSAGSYTERRVVFERDARGAEVLVTTSTRASERDAWVTKSVRRIWRDASGRPVAELKHRGTHQWIVYHYTSAERRIAAYAEAPAAPGSLDALARGSFALAEPRAVSFERQDTRDAPAPPDYKIDLGGPSLQLPLPAGARVTQWRAQRVDDAHRVLDDYIDTNLDGVAEAYIGERFDARARLVMHAEDGRHLSGHPAGALDQWERWIYGGGEQLLSEELQSLEPWGSGVAWFVYRTRYDYAPSGRLSQRVVVRDGFEPAVERSEYTWRPSTHTEVETRRALVKFEEHRLDPEGRVIEELVDGGLSRPDGELDERVVHEHDADGLRIHSIYYKRFGNRSFQEPYFHRYMDYDRFGRHIEHRDEYDGLMLSTRHEHHPGSSRRARTITSRWNDVPMVSRYEYNDAKRQMFRIDQGGVVETTTFDEHARPITIAYGDARHVTISYDPETGRVVREDVDGFDEAAVVDGYPDGQISYEYGDGVIRKRHERVQTIERDWGCRLLEGEHAPGDTSNSEGDT